METPAQNSINNTAGRSGTGAEGPIILQEEYRRRLALVQDSMRLDGLDLLVSADSGGWLPPTGDGRYLTGFSFTNMAPVFTGLVIVVPDKGQPMIVLPGGPQGEFADWAQHIAHNARVHQNASLLDGIVDTINEMSRSGDRVGIGQRFEDFHLLPDRLPGHTVIDARESDSTGSHRSPFERARSIKSEYEIDLLSAAQRAADSGMFGFQAALSPGTRNAVAQSAARHEAVESGAEDALIIMNAGTDPWVWWHYQADRTIPADEIVSVEVNTRVAGYSAQLARSGLVGNSEAGQRLLDAGVASVEAMAGALQQGVTGHDIWRAGTQALRAGGLNSWGRLGHGMGLAMDEGIAVVEGNETQLDIGAVIAIHAAPWDPGTRRSALIGEQYVIRPEGPAPLSETVPPRTWSSR